MQTSLTIPGANCPTCFNETVDAVRTIDGVRSVTGSFAAACISIEHEDVSLDTLTGVVHEHLHGVVMFSNEIQMMSIDPSPAPCVVHDHHPHPDTAGNHPAGRVDRP